MSIKKGKNEIAVIGIGCRYPGADTPLKLWENILARRQEFRKIPDNRLPLHEYYDSDAAAPDKTYGRRAAVIDGYEFDWAGKRIPKSTYESMDIAHWLALDIAEQAILDAGYNRESITKDRTGVIVGNTLTGEFTRSQFMRQRWPYIKKVFQKTAKGRISGEAGLDEFLKAFEETYKSPLAPMTEDSLAGGLSNTIAGRICNYFDLNGGGYTVDGACSSSLLAVITAARALAENDMDIALAGGVDISLDTFELIGFAKTGALTGDQMNVYDKDGKGFIPGEGCGFMVMKRLEQARQDGDRVYGILEGWGVSSDGKGGLTAPKNSGQSLALKRAYDKAGYGPDSLDFIEGHGTGTTVGDRVELEGIALTLGEEAAPRTCGVTSFKSIVGHTKAAAGVGAVIKAIMAVNRRIIPPTSGCNNPHPIFADQARALYPLRQGEVVESERELIAGVSAMGFGGINSHVTLKSGPIPQQNLAPELDERALLVSNQKNELFLFSADSFANLAAKAADIRAGTEGISQAELTDLAAFLSRNVNETAQIRAAIMAGSVEELLQRLQVLEDTSASKAPAPGEFRNDLANGIMIGNEINKTRIGYMFPGQGSQSLNMTRTLLERFHWAREIGKELEEAFAERGVPNVLSKLFKNPERAPDESTLQEWNQELSRIDLAQASVLLSSLLWFEYLKTLGLNPVATGGHSLGELMSFYGAGAYSRQELLKFAALRATSMAEFCAPGGMVALNCSLTEAQALLENSEEFVQIANINGPRQIIISGTDKGITEATAKAQAREIPNKPLPVSGALHTQLMADGAARLQNEGPAGNFSENPNCTLFSSTSGEAVSGGTKLRTYFSRQVVSPVQFTGMVERMSSECDIMLEVGPRAILSQLLEDFPESNPCLPLEKNANDESSLLRTLGFLFVSGVNPNWKTLYTNRLVRPFLRADERNFITNPLERELRVPAISGQGLTAGGGVSVQLPEHIPADYLERRGDFLNRVMGEIIRADMGMPAAAVPSAPVASTTPASESAPTFAPPATASAPPATNSVENMLLEMLAKRTGFGMENLSADLRLLDDLNLDSIKVGELIGALARKTNVSGPADLTRFANATIGEIAEFFSKNSPENPAQSSKEEFETDESWVRNFAMKDLPAPLEVGSGNYDWSNEKIIVIYENNYPLSLKRLKKVGIDVFALNFEEVSQKSAQPEFFQQAHVLAFLPPFLESAIDGTEKHINKLQTLTLLMGAGLNSLSFIQHREPGSGELLESAAAGAFVASLHHETPELKIRNLELAPGLNEDKIAKILFKELDAESTYEAAIYDENGRRYVPRPILQNPVHYTQRSRTITSEDVVLITGGARGITAECALALARKTGATMVLSGSSPHPDEEQKPGNEIAATLERFSAAGLKAAYQQCDIRDPRQLKAVRLQVEAELGPITVLIHGAGVNRPRPAVQVTTQEALEETAPKLEGALNLAREFAGANLKLFAALSSIIGVTGMPGNAWYAFSNEALNIVLEQFALTNLNTDIQAIAYSVWGETGMGAKMGSTKNLARMGIGAIPTEEGVQRFLEIIESDSGANEVIVTARLGGLDSWRPVSMPIPRANRFLENIIQLEPGVEIVTRAQLRADYDLYLNDHNYNGSLLFPTVFGLEAMAQAVACVTGREGFGALNVKDIDLSRPIVVPPETGNTIQIRAEVLEPQAQKSELRVKVGISTETTDFSSEHFSAIFVLDGVEQTEATEFIPTQAPLDLLPKIDLYGPVLFQGPRFQRIETIYEMTESGATFASERKAGTEVIQDCFAGEEQSVFILGDPFFRDTVLQSIQLSTTRGKCLPVRIQRLEIHSLADEISGPGIIQSRLTLKEQKDLRSQVRIFSKEGALLEKLVAFDLKILEVIETNPLPEEFADVNRLYENILMREYSQFEKELNDAAPRLSLCRSPHMLRLPREKRHEIQKEIVQTACKQNIHKTPVFNPKDEISLDWDENGKPLIRGLEQNDLEISIAHDDTFFLSSIGVGPQGCDLEPVTPRSPEDWKNLLGIHHKQQELLLKQGEELNRAGTYIWSALEALKKAGGQTEVNVSFLKKPGQGVIFTSRVEQKQYKILAFPVELIKQERIVALAYGIKDAKIEQEAPETPALPATKKEKDGLMEEGIDEFGRKYFSYRFRLSFKETCNFRRKTPFPLFSVWMGKIREVPMNSISNEFVRDMLSGDWGSVTNNTKIHILGEADAFDLIEGRLYTSRIWGENDTSIDLNFEFDKILTDGSPQRIAYSAMSITWVKVIGHGLVAKETLPEYLRDWCLEHLTNYGGIDENVPAMFTGLTPGQALYPEKAGPRIEPIIAENNFVTSYEDSNLVGNIYYANYYAWQARVLDKFLHTSLPRYFSAGVRPEYDLFYTSTKVDHLREAMPFDTIQTTMALKGLHENGLTFYFEYFRVNPGEEKVKLAVGELEAVWVKVDHESKSLETENFPADVRDVFSRLFSPVSATLVGLRKRAP